jgi:hypothetical protein
MHTPPFRKKSLAASLLLLICTGCASSPFSEDEVQHTDSSTVDATIYERRSDFIACYDKSEKRRTGLVSVRFRIESGGKVSQAGADMTTLRDSAVESCLVQVLSRIVFPVSSHGAVDYQYPFKFVDGKATMSPNPR